MLIDVRGATLDGCAVSDPEVDPADLPESYAVAYARVERRMVPQMRQRQPRRRVDRVGGH